MVSVFAESLDLCRSSYFRGWFWTRSSVQSHPINKRRMVLDVFICPRPSIRGYTTMIQIARGASVVAAVFGSCFGVKGPKYSVHFVRSPFSYFFEEKDETLRSIPWCCHKICKYHDDYTATACKPIWACLSRH